MNNYIENIVREEISKFNRTTFTEVPDEIFQRLKLRKFSDEANRSHMKIFKAKDGREFLLKKNINQDIFHAYLFPDLIHTATATYDVHNDYFTGYEHQQSIEVKPDYRRLGLATALTDFAENIYNIPYKPSKLLSPEMQGFTQNRFNDVVQEEISNFRNSLKKVLNSSEAYQTLDNSSAGESTWCAGGCAILAFALNIAYGYPIYVIYDYDWKQIDHFIVKTPNNTYIDCDGEQRNIVDNFRKKEHYERPDVKLEILPYTPNLRNNGIPIDMDASQKLAELIKN